MIDLIVNETCGFAVIDVCEVAGIDISRMHPEISAGMRNADPVVLPVLEAVGRLYRVHRARLEPHTDRIGMIQSGLAFPRAKSQRVFSDVSRNGRVSPVAFINANAGAAISFCCTRFGFRGPTLHLTMTALRAQSLANALAATWLARGDARYLILATADFSEHDDIRVTAVLAGKHDSA
ncbi:hypothetical protein [Paraburkholderia phosphatilytica]|uniref:hypothetical protein n=1 Tax=Paraburkholderia phosphatilytica TaxID=2282883 RepID=UPI000E4E3092|nr:hypothetical protein [Paraburkholderia phosphatilytica]